VATAPRPLLQRCTKVKRGTLEATWQPANVVSSEPYRMLKFVLVPNNQECQNRNISLHGTLKDWTKFTTRNNEKQQKKIKFFL
jgi:hypothetical protein